MGVLSTARARGEAAAYAGCGLEKHAFVGALARGLGKGVGFLGRQAGLWGTKNWGVGQLGTSGWKQLVPTITRGPNPSAWQQAGVLGKTGLAATGVGSVGLYGASKLMQHAEAGQLTARRARPQQFSYGAS